MKARTIKKNERKVIMKKIRFGIQKTLSNGFDGVYGIFIIPTIELSTERGGNGDKPNKIINICISLTWLKWDLYMNLSL